MATAICRRTKEGLEFLEYFTLKENPEKEAEELNRTKPEKLWNGVNINWNNTKEFFVEDVTPFY